MSNSNSLNPWIPIPENSDFSIYNLPAGIFSTDKKKKRAGIAIGTKVLDLKIAAEAGLFEEVHNISPEIFDQSFLNEFIALGKKKTGRVRKIVQEELCNPDSVLKELEELFDEQSDVQMHLPVKTGDYTDFYSSLEHASNVGKMFRDPENALLPNWKHMPVGYHGRASSIIVSGENIHRPLGQRKPHDDSPPEFGPSQLLDFELEIAFIIGQDTELGDSVPADEAEEYIYGLVLFNDWSARDIQKWEYVPLGPFLGKSFASSISPWIVPLEALEPFRVEGPVQKPEVLPYLKSSGKRNIDINLEVSLSTRKQNEPETITRTNFSRMYWDMSQQLAHHTVNGCNINVGDMMASGTVSGEDPGSYGSLLELSWAGQRPLKLSSGEKRTFLEDGDTVSMKAWAGEREKRVGFGSVQTKILPAKKHS